MSAFEGTGTTGTEEQTPENFLEHLVGDGKKFSDAESLARGKFESDRHVTNLERQIAELREDIDQGTKITELMEMVRKQNESTEKTETTSTESHSETSSGQMTEDELKSLISTHVSERDKQTAEAKNLAEADKALRDKYGETSARVVKERADDLGMSVEEMQEFASRNPKGFFRLMDMDSTRKESGSFVGGGQRSESVPLKNANTRDFAHYQDLRRKNKALYHKPTTQQAMMDDLASMGKEAFYSNS